MAREREEEREGPLEISVVGDLIDNQASHCEKLLEVEPGGECVLYFDSGGGSAYSGIALASFILLRSLRATGVVIGECSSAAIWPFATCSRRLVTPYSVLLFHPMKWQSEEHVLLAEAAEWARHFGELEGSMDRWLAELFGVSLDVIEPWIRPGRFVSGAEMVELGLAEMTSLKPLDVVCRPSRR